MSLSLMLSPRLALRTADYLALPRATQPWVIQDILPVGGKLNIFGRSKSGKSFAALKMAEAISTGQAEWLGRAVKVHGPVVYVQIDNPRSLWMDRMEDVRRCPLGGHNLDNLFNIDREIAPFPFNILGTGGAWLRQDLDSLRQGGIEPVAVIVDTLRDAFPGDENDSSVMSAVIAALEAAISPSAMVLVSHARKELQDAKGPQDLMSENRGSNVVPAKMDTIMKFTAWNEKTKEQKAIFQGRAVELTTLTLRACCPGSRCFCPVLSFSISEVQAILAKLPVGVSENAMTAMVAARMGVSDVTARRRVKEALAAGSVGA